MRASGAGDLILDHLINSVSKTLMSLKYQMPSHPPKLSKLSMKIGFKMLTHRFFCRQRLRSVHSEEELKGEEIV